MRWFRPAALLVAATCISAPDVLAQADYLPGASPDGVSPDPKMPRPIDAFDTVFLEEMTWLEVRDAIRSGKTTVIIATGGVEQNGPYLALGKHNYVLRATTEAIARKLGNALVAPIVPFVPEGDIDPPTGHMRYPGTISVQESTFTTLLVDMASSLRTHGFQHVILIGDSGGNQRGMKEVADALGAQWAGGATTIHYIPEYYDNRRIRAWLDAHGVLETDQGFHDSFQYEAIMMSVDPMTVRLPQRLAAGKLTINGVDLLPLDRTLALARRLVDYQATFTVEAIRRALGS